MNFFVASVVTLLLSNALEVSAQSFPALSKAIGDARANYPKTGCFELTAQQNNKKGAVWSSGKINTTWSWHIDAKVYLGSNDNGGDGMAFVLQNNGNSKYILGGGGGGKGYSGIRNGFVIEIDTYPDGNGGSSGDYIQAQYSQYDGSFKSIGSKGSVSNLEDNKEHWFSVKYDQGRIFAGIDGKRLVNVAVDLKSIVGEQAYYGYTAATGGASNQQYVCPNKYYYLNPPTSQPTPPPTSPPTSQPTALPTPLPTSPPTSQPTTPPSGSVKGDPHFKTWSGEKYDFHGVCDLVLLQDNDFENGVGLNIHIRTRKTRMWSYIHTAAVRIGDDILEVMGEKGESNFWVNKVKGSSTDEIWLSGNPVTFTQLSEKSHKFVIDLNNHDNIEIKMWNGMVSLKVNNENGGHFENSLGLMGTFPTGMKVARDGTTVIKDDNEFGQEWQVLPTEPMLFHEVDGPQSPESCEIPSTVQMRRRLGEGLISRGDAEVACSRVDAEDFELCVFDVMATNDRESAGAY